MSYAANTPISGPARQSDFHQVHADFNGVMWSNEVGFVFAPPADNYQDQMDLPPDWQLQALRR